MHKTLLILVVLLLLQPGAAAAGVANTPFEQRCERDMKPQLHVTSRDEGYQINNVISSRILNNRSQHH